MVSFIKIHTHTQAQTRIHVPHARWEAVYSLTFIYLVEVETHMSRVGDGWKDSQPSTAFSTSPSTGKRRGTLLFFHREAPHFTWATDKGDARHLMVAASLGTPLTSLM